MASDYESSLTTMTSPKGSVQSTVLSEVLCSPHFTLVWYNSHHTYLTMQLYVALRNVRLLPQTAVLGYKLSL